MTVGSSCCAKRLHAGLHLVCVETCSSADGLPGIHNFFTCHVSMHWRCHALHLLIKSVAGLCGTESFHAFSVGRLLLRKYLPYNRKSHSYHCSRQLFYIQGHGSENLSIEGGNLCLDLSWLSSCIEVSMMMCSSITRV